MKRFKFALKQKEEMAHLKSHWEQKLKRLHYEASAQSALILCDNKSIVDLPIIKTLGGGSLLWLRNSLYV